MNQDNVRVEEDFRVLQLSHIEHFRALKTYSLAIRLYGLKTLKSA
jgi:hypothetical protein